MSRERKWARIWKEAEILLSFKIVFCFAFLIIIFLFNFCPFSFLLGMQCCKVVAFFSSPLATSFIFTSFSSLWPKSCFWFSFRFPFPKNHTAASWFIKKLLLYFFFSLDFAPVDFFSTFFFFPSSDFWVSLCI